MGLADAAIHGIVDNVAFLASDAPYLMLDTDLRIRGGEHRVSTRDVARHRRHAR